LSSLFSFPFNKKQTDIDPCTKISDRCVMGSNLFNLACQTYPEFTEGCQYKSPGQGQKTMTQTVKELSKAKDSKINGNAKVQDTKKPVERKRSPENKLTVQPNALTIDEKLNKLNDLNDLVAKRNRLKGSQDKLKSFNLKKEDHSTSIELSDHDGNRFSTSNTAAVESFIRSTNEVIQKELDAVEAKIQF